MNIVKKIGIFVLAIIIVCLLVGIFVWDTNKPITLSQIVDKFNSSNPMAEHLSNTYNSVVNANLEDNKIILVHNNSPFADSKISKVEFCLEDNILKTTINNSTESTTSYLDELSMAWMLIDCIGQLNGYEKEQFYETLKPTGENYKDYSLDNEGLEIKISDSGTSINIDLFKKIPIINVET